jgi:hypothetical protein
MWIVSSTVLPVFCMPPAASSVSFAVKDNTVTAWSPKGYAVWKRRVADGSQVAVRALPNGRFDLGDGTIVDDSGRVVRDAQITPRTGVRRAGLDTGPAWDPLVTVTTTDTTEFSGPVFDPSGNAWAAVLSTDFTVVQSIGVSGAWQPPHTLIADANNNDDSHDVFNPKIAVDHSGVVHVLYRGLHFNGTNGNYDLDWFSYAPGVGWQGPFVVDTGADFFQKIEVAVDAANNVIVIFDRETNGGNATWSVLYSAANHTWGQAQRISGPDTSPLVQTLAQNTDGSAIWLAYWNFARPQGVFTQPYNPSTQSWSAPQRLQGPAVANWGFILGSGISTHYPMTVDSAGRVTLLAPYYLIIGGAHGSLTFTTIWGYRNENGHDWAPTQLLPDQGPFSLKLFSDILDFGDAIVSNSSGQFLAATNLDFDGLAQLYGFHFKPGVGWSVEQAVQPTTGTRVTVASFASNDQAVVVYDDAVPTLTLESVLYTSGGWSTLSGIPGGLGSYFAEAATAPSGEVLLLFDEHDVAAIPGVFATWLRP